MNLLNQLRDDAGRLADQAIPEVTTAVNQLIPPGSLARVVVALIGRLEQDIPGLVHPSSDFLPNPLTTPVEQPEPVAVVPPNPPAPAPAAQVPQSDPTVQRLEAELAAKREMVIALQSALTPAPEAPPVVSTQTQEVPAA